MSSKAFTYLLIFAMLLWAGGWPALKILTDTMDYRVITFWRFFLMIFAFIPILFLLNKPLKLKRDALPYILSGALLNVLFMIFAFLGVKYGSAGSGGVMITTLSPLLTFLLVAYTFKKRFEKMQLIGIVFGLLGGIVMLNIFESSVHFNGGEIYFLLAALVWAILTLIAQKSHHLMHPIHYNFYISIVATVMMFILTLPQDLLEVKDQSFSFWSALLYLAIFGQSIATSIYFIASQRLGSATASSFMFLVPSFALILSYFILHETIKLHIVVGGLLALTGLYIINKSHQKKA